MPLWRRFLMWFQAMAVVVIGGYDLQTLRPWAQSMAYDASRDPTVAVVTLAKKAEMDFRLQVQLGNELAANRGSVEATARSAREFAQQGQRVHEDIGQLKVVDWLSPTEQQLLRDFATAAAAYNSRYSFIGAAQASIGLGQPPGSALQTGSERQAARAAAALVKALTARLGATRMASIAPGSAL